MRVLVTGAAGFIGFHTSMALLNKGYEVYGFDNVNDYYNPAFKHLRLKRLHEHPAFQFTKGSVQDAAAIEKFWLEAKPDLVIHLAAQAGVRYSIENPMTYIESNIVGFQNVLELTRAHMPKNFVYASSSSVYGGIRELPFHEEMNTNCPISLYAVTKMENELAAKAYSRLFNIPTTGLRFFTVYGPYGRPDMAMFKFAELMQRGEAIPVYNNGKMVRDFTFIDDIVRGVLSAVEKPQMGKVYNLGRGSQVNLLEMIRALETELGVKAKMEMLPIQLGDVEATISDVSLARRELGYSPTVDIGDGVKAFAKWYREVACKIIPRM